MKYSTSATMTAKEIRDKSEPWLKFIRNLDRAVLAAKRKAFLIINGEATMQKTLDNMGKHYGDLK